MLDIVQNFTQKVQIIIRINVIDKRTGKIAYISEERYDHCAITTSMKDKGGHVKKSIIIDPYFNKAMTCNEAQDEYLALILMLLCWINLAMLFLMKIMIL